VSPPPPATPKARPRGAIVFSTEPAYAEVWIGGRRRCNTPCTLELPAGPVNVTLRNPVLGREEKRVVKVRAGSSRKDPVRLHVEGFR
jgi:hypothetical protein